MKQRNGSSVTRPVPERDPAAVVAAACLILLSGCAKNPVTGHRQLMLISEQQEFAIGEGADKEVRQEYGSYLDSPSLRSYVDGVGNSLAAKGERPGMVFHFDVLNSPVINAFALPGGFVYVTRGMLERLSSEDELAMVVGHEIGHVTARHGAARLSTLYAMQYGTLLGAVISPTTVGNYGDLINLAMQVGLSKYSRDQEAQADRLGVGYAAEVGYQPKDAVTVMKILKWMEGREPGALEKWFLSHPPADERIADVSSQVRSIEQKDPAVTSRPTRRDDYLKRIDGLIVGLYNGAEMVLKDRYYNKELAVSLRVPPGWEVNLDPNGALVAMNQKDKQYAFLEADPMHTSTEPADMEREFEKTLKRRGYTRTGGSQKRTGQERIVHLASYSGHTSKGEAIGVLKGFLVQGKQKWTYTAVCEQSLFAKNREDYESQLLDLRFMDEAEVARLQPPRLKVMEAPAGATWESLSREHLSDPDGAERLAFYNGLDPNTPVAGGMLVKIPPSLAVKP